MKTLYLMRHAKSSWKDPSLDDFERPLNKRGLRDAPFMGKLLRDMDVRLNMIVSSPANRAIATARIVAKKLKYRSDDIGTSHSLYEGGLDGVLSVVHETDDVIKRLMLVGHNPTFTEAANYLADANIENIPTGGVVAIKFKIASWQEAGETKGRLKFFEYPKKRR